jgi:Domain of unknown function (DUF5615)
LQYATAANRVLITENRQDFLDLHLAVDHAGIIICKSDRDYSGKVCAIVEFMTQDPRSLENRLLRLLKENVKKYGQTFIVKEYPKV